MCVCGCEFVERMKGWLVSLCGDDEEEIVIIETMTQRNPTAAFNTFKLF